MFHMALGCHWHHGLGTAGSCNHQSNVSACCHEHDHQGCEHEDADTPLTLAYDNDGADQNHDHHACCQDDSCSLFRVVKYKFPSLDFLTRYLNGAEDFAILKSASAGLPLDLFPDHGLSAPSVRAHLLFGVQLI